MNETINNFVPGIYLASYKPMNLHEEVCLVSC